MNCGHCFSPTDNGANPFVANIEQNAMQNSNFRTAFWTEHHLQMTLMCTSPSPERNHTSHESRCATGRILKFFQNTVYGTAVKLFFRHLPAVKKHRFSILMQDISSNCIIRYKLRNQ